MEFEKTLFRVHERFLSYRGQARNFEYIFKGTGILALILIPVFIYGNAVYNVRSPCLQPIVKSQFVLDPINSFSNATKNATNGTLPAITKDTFLTIKIVEDPPSGVPLANATDVLLTMEFSGTGQLVHLDETIRSTYNFTNYNIYIPSSCYGDSVFSSFVNYFLDLETILINEIAATFDGFNRFMRNTETGENWVIFDSEVVNYENSDSLAASIVVKSLYIIKIALGLFLVSNITAIYDKMTIICAPIFILMTYRCCVQRGQQQHMRSNLYRAFPWIGMYLYTLNNNGRFKDRYIVMAFFALMLIFYCLYLSALVFWDAILFAKAIPKGLDENFYGFVTLLEFTVMLFLRTRSTLKYFPRVSTLLILSFLYYVQRTPYGFYKLGLNITVLLVVSFLVFCLMTFEIPALNWNPSYHYTPSVDRPRTLFFPMFSLSWYHDLPQLWTMFYPLYGASHFSAAELSMVNRNLPLLNATLENQGRAAGENPGDGQMGQFGMDNQDNSIQDFGGNAGGNGVAGGQNVNLLGNGGNRSSAEQNLLNNNANQDVHLDIQGDLTGNSSRNVRTESISREDARGPYQRIEDPRT